MEFYWRLFVTSLLFTLMLSPAASSPVFGTRRHGRLNKKTTELRMNEMEDETGGYKTYYYTQTLDHFNYKKDSYRTFQQRYALNTDYWGGPETNSPIFVYLEGEGPLWIGPNRTILVAEAPKMKALVLMLEHRYYGESIPFAKVPHKAKELGYLSSEQALADWAEIIMSLKTNLSAQHCPVIVHGGSYAGMLTFWMRLKYPHVVLGAYASSAPLTFFMDSSKESLYTTVVSNDFKEVSSHCYHTIKSSWDAIDELGSKPGGLDTLSKKFQSCSRFKTTDDLKSFLIDVFSGAAQYGYVVETCMAINAKPQGSDLFSRLLAGAVASGYDIDYKEGDCYELRSNYTAMRMNAWLWQTCTEMIQPPEKNEDTMFRYTDAMYSFSVPCRRLFGVSKRPHWTTIEYGTEDMKRELKHATSNVIFTNGLMDPYSSGGILHNISDTIIALPTSRGSHCEDMVYSHRPDPDWLREQKEAILKIINGWIEKYNAEYR